MNTYHRIDQKTWKSRLSSYMKFLLRWGWFIVLSMILATAITYLIPDVTTPPTYQATLRIQIPLPTNLDGTQDLNNSTSFFSSLFISPPTLSLVLPKYKDFQLSDLQSLVTTAPVGDTNYFTLSAIGATPHDATALVTDVYNAALTELHARRSEIDAKLTAALNTELKQAQNDASGSLSILQNLTSEHLGTSPEYLQVNSLYQEQIKRIDSINQQLLALEQQGFGSNDILRLGSITPDMITTPGPEPTQGQRLALSPLVGLIMGLGGILLARTFSNELPLRGRKREIVLPRVIATLPVLPGTRKWHLQVLKDSTPCLSLLQHLQFQADENGKQLQLITITSPSGREGKSTVAAGLALAAAQSGLRTLLVDANPQRPVLHTRFRLPNTTGTLDTIQSLAVSTTSLSPIQRTFENNLGIILIGKKQPSPEIFAEALPIDHLRPFTETLRKQADCIIFDGPPILNDANAANLVQLSDKALLVVDAYKSKSTDVVEAENLLSTIGASSAIVLNRASSEDLE